MVSLPLFKFAALFVRHISKYGGNWIKSQAHEHPRFRNYAERYGQKMHQINMRMAVTLLKNSEAEKRAREKTEVSTVKTEQQTSQEEVPNLKSAANEKTFPKEVSVSVWKRKFRPLPEGKAVELFANVLGDSFVLLVAGSLIFYEYARAKGKPDANAEKIAELSRKLQELDEQEQNLERLNSQTQTQLEVLEMAVLKLENDLSKKLDTIHFLTTTENFAFSQTLFKRLIEEEIMFCSSLRGRHEWIRVPDILLTAKSLKWREYTLENCDLALPFPLLSKYNNPPESFRFLMLSTLDLNDPSATQDRIQKIYHRFGGRNIGIIYLLQQQGQNEKNPESLLTFQASFLSDFEIPIVPLLDVDSLEPTLQAFQRHLKYSSNSSPGNLSAITLLPFCSIHPPIPDHARNLISDICSSISGLQRLVTTREGMELLEDILSDYAPLAQDIFKFWHEEHVFE